MNIKNLIASVIFAVVTTTAIQYFINNWFLKKDDQAGQIKSGQTFVAPETMIQTQPLNRAVDFIDSDLKSDKHAQETHIKTDAADYYFTSHGALLEKVIFKRTTNSLEIPVTFSQKTDANVKNFLVALNTKTPFIYQIKERASLPSVEKIVYQASVADADIEKEFVIFKDKFQVDLNLKINPKKEGVQPRLFFFAPQLIDLKSDVISAVFNTERGSLKKELREKIDLSKGWFAPNFFGVENRYFVNAMIKDPQNFGIRAYYALQGQTDLNAIIEGPSITKPMQWNLSFYLGPKEESAMNLVDSRLKETLDYSGLLAPLARILLAILKYINNFLHNYGWTIIILTIIINLVLLPFSIKSAKGMKKSAEFHKKMAYIQQKYKNDPETFSKEQADLISKYGIMGGMGGGCLIKFLQLPILFALSRVLSGSFELYKVPFLWIPDLSSADPYFILPILITVGMMFIGDVTDIKQRFTMIAIALVFGCFSINFSAGLCLYILIGVLLAGLQALFQKKVMA